VFPRFGDGTGDRVETEADELFGHPVGSLVDPLRTRAASLPLGRCQPLDRLLQPVANDGVVRRLRPQRRRLQHEGDSKAEKHRLDAGHRRVPC
jgi:hypothetical protein